MRNTALAVVALGTVLGLACASGPEPAPTAPSSDAAGDRLTDVRVESGDDATTVTLAGVHDPIYTAFLHTEPRALVLDLAAVEIDTPNDLVMVYDGFVENVTVSTYGGGVGEPLTRVEIALAEDVGYEIHATDEGLQAVLSHTAGQAASQDEEEDVTVSATDADDPWADPDAEQVSLDESEGEELVPAEPAPPATALTAIEVETPGDGVLVHLAMDGAVGAMETFTLSGPDRLVVDLPGLTSKVEKGRVGVKSAPVTGIRVGAHADKVRVVIDGGPAAAGFVEKQISPARTGLYLAIGGGEELEMALSDALRFQQMAAAGGEVPESEPQVPGDETDSDELVSAEDSPWADEGGDAEPVASTDAADSDAARVYGIHYDSETEYERVVILSDELVDYDLHEPDPETVVVSILNARVAPEASGRVPVPAKRPISLISTFQQPDVEVPEVRVVIQRATDLEPSVLRRGSMIFLDFPNTGLVAAPPPAFSPYEPENLAGPEVGIDMAAEEGAAGDTRVAAPGFQDAEQGAASSAAGGQEYASAVPGEGPTTLEDFEAVPDLGGPMDESMGTPVGAPAALEPPAAAEILQEGGLIDGKQYEGRRISLDFKDVPVADVLRLIAEVSDLNLIAGDEVEGNVTIRLVDVPWDQALDVILLTKGLGFVRVGNVLRIAPADIIKAEEEVRLQERRNKETLEDLVVKLQPVNYANVADMSELVKRLLTPRGTVNVDSRTNTLIIKDIPSVIDEATALIKAIDTETPQVLIEAKIVEAALDFSRELGSTWAVGTNELEDGFGGNAPNRDLGGPDFRFHDANNVIFGNPITSVPTAVLNMNAFVLNEDFNVNVQIQAAESTGDGKVISSPRVLTLDNREAEIQQGVSIPFQTFENGDAKLEFIDAVLSLLVTPHVTSDKSIIMQVEVTRNAPDDSVPTPTGSPAIARAETRTETLVKDGQTLVIGGIYTVNESTRESRVPYLHRLPLLGTAFKSKEVTDSRKELLIFVTPRIVLASELAGS